MTKRFDHGSLQWKSLTEMLGIFCSFEKDLYICSGFKTLKIMKQLINKNSPSIRIIAEDIICRGNLYVLYPTENDAMQVIYDSRYWALADCEEPVELSEEDRKMIDNACVYLSEYGNWIFENEKKATKVYKTADYLKSLKDRFCKQPQLTELEAKVKDLIFCSIQNSQNIDENTWAKKWAKDLLAIAKKELEK